MSAKHAISDTLQGSVATYLRRGGVVNKQRFIAECESEIFFLIDEYLAKLQARTWLSHVLCMPGQHAERELPLPRKHELDTVKL